MAATKYFEVYNADRILTIDDSYKNLLYHEDFTIETYKKYFQAAQFQSADHMVYQYFSDENYGWNVLVTFNVADKEHPIFSFASYYNAIISFRPPPSDDVLYFCYRVKDIYFIHITVPFDCAYGKTETALQNFLAQIVYVRYDEHEISKKYISGLLICNAKGEAVFSSEKYYMTVQKYFFKCLDDIRNAKDEFGTVTIYCDYDIEIAPFTAHQYILYTPQQLLHYRTYIKLTTKRTIECQIKLYTAIPNAEYAVGGTMGITTSFMLLKKIV